MPRITLQLAVEGTADVSRSLLGLATSARTAFAAMRAESNTTTQLMLANQRKAVLGEAQSMNARRLLIQRAAADWKTAEAAMVQAVATGAGNRLRLIQAEASSRKQLMDGLRTSTIQSEQLLTRAVEQEINKRTSAARAGAAAQARAAASGLPPTPGGAGGGGGGGTGGGGPGRGGRGVVGRMAGWVANNATTGVFTAMEASHDARYRRAVTADTMGRALAQVGGSRSDVQTAMGLVTGAAVRHGLPADVQAAAMEAAQTEFVALGDRDQLRNLSPGDRSARLMGTVQTQIQRAVAARNLGTDPREYLRMGAMMDQNHVADVDNTLADFVAMAERGAVNLSQVAGTALQPMLRSVAQAQEAAGPDATPAMRSVIANKEMRESLAFDEGLKSRGFDPRSAGTTRANMQVALRGNRTAELARTNLRNALHGARGPQRAAIESLLTGDNALFQADPSQHGHFQFNDAVRGNPIALAETLHRAGLDGTTASNIFAGGGHGNARSLMAPWRTMNAALMASDAEGVTGFQAIDRISTAHHTPEERARMTDLFENSPLANFVRQEEQRLTALSDNTSAIGRMSEALDRFRANHPGLAPVVEGAIPAAVGGAVVALGSGGAATAAGAGAAGATAAGAGTGAATALGAGTAMVMAPIAAFAGVTLATHSLTTENAEAEARGDGTGGSDMASIRRYRNRILKRDATTTKQEALFTPRQRASAVMMGQAPAPGSFLDSVASPFYSGPEPAAGPSMEQQQGGPWQALPGGSPIRGLAGSGGLTQAQMTAAMSQALSTTTIRVEMTPPAAVTAGTQGATDRGNAGANPQ